MSFVIDPSTIAPNMALGLVAIAVSLVCLIFRRRFRDAVVRHEGRMLGARAAGSLGRLQTPFWIGFAAVLGIMMGLVMITLSVVGMIGNA